MLKSVIVLFINKLFLQIKSVFASPCIKPLTIECLSLIGDRHVIVVGYEKTDLGLAVRAQLDGAAISDVLEQLKRCPAGLDHSLGKSVAFGVAFHHAGGHSH